MATFIGPRNDNFDLVDDIDVTPALETLDEIGGKRANVYVWNKKKVGDDEWRQFLPTPNIVYLDLHQMLEKGGIGSIGSIILKNIAVSLYNERDLETLSNDPNIKKYWVISGPGLEPKAYTTERITKTNALLWDVTLKVFKSINSKDIVIPPAGG